MIRINFNKILLTFIIICSFLSAKEVFSIKENRPGSLIIEFSIDSVWTSNKYNKIFTEPKLDIYRNPNNPQIPFFKEVLIGVPSNADIKIYDGDLKTIGSFSIDENNEDVIKLSNEKILKEKIFTGNFPLNNVTLTPTISLNDEPTSVIEIFPVETVSGILSYRKNITIQLTWNTQYSSKVTKFLSKSQLDDLNQDIKTLKKDYSFSIPEYQYSDNIAKIIVDTTGWYGITQDALVDSGIDIKKIDPSTIRLWNMDNEVLVFVEGYEDNSFDKLDQIIFYGEKAKSPESAPYDNNFYTKDNVYWLTWGGEPGKRYLTESVYPSLPNNQVYHPQRGTYRFSKKIERDEVFIRLTDVNVDEQWDTIDHFFMQPSISTGETVRFPFIIPRPDRSSNSTYDLKIGLQGITRDDRNVEVKINERLAISGEWYGQTAFQIASDLNAGLGSEYLNNDTNYISIDLSGNSYGKVQLNWFEISYDKLYNAVSDYIEFSRDKSLAINTQFSVEGFTDSDIFLFKEGVSRLRDYIVEESSTNRYEITFQDFYGENSPSYHAFTRDKLIEAKIITPQNPISNKLQDIQKSYVAIAPDSFKNTLEPLIDLHNGEIVDVDEIYRQYSYGIMSPYAIREFLQDIYYTHNNLEYVLIGIRNNDYFNANNSFYEMNYIPSMQIIATEYGAVVSDYWYACLNEDLFPDIAIGRFPVASVEELEIIVNKSIDHINRQPASWENNILFIGGFEEKFKEQSEDLLKGWVDKGHFISRLYIDQLSEKTSFYGTTDTLLHHLNRGLSYINFVGHGGGAVWGDRSILGLSDVENISNGTKLPFVTSMTCFTADYANPNSLGRKMLIHENGGAIGWFGSAGKGWIGSDYLLIEPLNQLLYSGADYTIGEMINMSKMIYYVSNPNTSRRAKTMLYQFNIAGDPALKLKNKLSGTSTLTPNNPESGEQININIESSSTDSVYYQFYQPKLDSIEIETAQDTTLYQYFYYDNYSANQPTYVGQTNDVTYTLPNTSENGIHNFNISYKSGNNIVQSNNSFAIEGTKIKIIEINPENPTYLESIQVKASISDKHSINSVQLFVDNEYWSDMINISDDIYELINPIPPQPASTYIRIYIRVVDGNGSETISPEQIISIYTLPNIRPNSLYFKVDEDISLTAEIENTKVAPTTSEVKLYIYKNNDWKLTGEKSIDFDGQDTKSIDFPGFYPNGKNEYRLIAKSDMAQSPITDDTLEISLPTEYFWVISNLGTTEDGINHSAVGNDIVTVNIEPGSIENNQIIEIKNVSNSVVLSQPDFEIVQFDEENFAFEINMESPTKYEVDWSVKYQIDEPIKMFKYYSDFLTWLPESNVTIDNNIVNFESENSGTFAFLNNYDVESPFIDASVNGQKYLSNSYLNDSPVFSFSIYDENGVDFRVDSIITLINGKQEQNIITNINGGLGNLGVEVSPNLMDSDSTLSLIVQDAAGNKADTLKLEFIVSTELQLIDYGNYPNPFIDNTKFAYELSETVDELTFIIYSVEGRRIRKLTRLESLTELDLRFGGYHEINWNGSNDSENIVGNGTYFYIIRAKKDKEILERTGKIVKAK